MNIIKEFLKSRFFRFLLFIFLFFFVFKVVDYIFAFFDISREVGYVYFSWFSVLFILLVILPMKRSNIWETKRVEVVASGIPPPDTGSL